ncbi:MAG: DUF4288 domain-containing protein [Nitrospirae bacterium]|nr:DUF4288 domain-containing protein [Nitrospirota bacterium]
MRSPWKWYGVKTVYRCEPSGRPLGTDECYSKMATLVEERVVLLKARGFDEAIEKAKREARGYVSDSYRNPYGQQVKNRFLGYCDAYLADGNFGTGGEVYSETEVVSRAISDKTLLKRLVGYHESKKAHKARRNILQIEFTPPAPGVKRTRTERAFVEKYGTCKSRR